MKLLNRLLAACVLAAALATATTAFAGVKAVVDKSTQSMQVYQDGTLLYSWDVSTGKQDSWTPTGTFGVQEMDANHYSSIYKGGWMPHAVFFNGNVAVHGTYKSNYQYLGDVASHGCVRLTQEHAKTFYNLVLEVGQDNVTIVVVS